MKKIIIILGLICSTNISFSQIEYGGQPLSISEKIETINKEFVLPNYDFEIVENVINEPIKIGELRKLNINVLTDINPIESGAHLIYKFKIRSIGANSVSLYFNQFVLSENTRVFFYNDSEIYGSYNYLNVIHKSKPVFVSPMMDGDGFIVEINILKEEKSSNLITVSDLIHRPIGNEFMNQQLKKLQEELAADRTDCLVDVLCPEGEEWCNQIRSVALFSFIQQLGGVPHCINSDVGEEFSCSGALINNVNNNFKQYFLTARHCTKCDIDHNTTTFKFNHQRAKCSLGAGNTAYILPSVQGSASIEHAYCDVSHSDISLLEILDPIPLQYNVYFSGWDANSQSLYTGVHSISHPHSLPKKITGGQIQFFVGPKWDVYWDFGAIFGISSGGPVFKDENKKIVGVISGSIENNCQGLNQTWVGKLASCWNVSEGIVEHLANGQSSLKEWDGIDPILACQEGIGLNGEFRDARIYNANKQQIHLQAEKTVLISNNANSEFQENSSFKITAGDKITLLPGNNIILDGTHIIEGAIFSAYIAPCSLEGYCGYEENNENYQKSIENSIVVDKNDIYTIYPNPSSEDFNIAFELQKSQKVQIQVLNADGYILFEKEFLGEKGLNTENISLKTNQKILFAKICIGEDCHYAKLLRE